jgi:alpha(1,3/1,4) fucosyltransferase
MRTLMCVGISNVAKLIALRPDFDECWAVDGDKDRVEYLRSLFRFDKEVHLAWADPSSFDIRWFCEKEGPEEIDTLFLSPADAPGVTDTSIKWLLEEKNVRQFESLSDPGSEALNASTDPSGLFGPDLSGVLDSWYEPVKTGGTSPFGPCAVWRRKADGRSGKAAGNGKSQCHFNLVYGHLADAAWHEARRGNVTVTVSSIPLPECDLHVYLDAFGYAGKQKGFDLLFLCEPHVVLTGSYNEDLWDNFDHVFTIYDALVERHARLTKVPVCRQGWFGPSGRITESMAERERLYPLEVRRNAICMINGNKCSWVTGELYSKRSEAALWFWRNSDIPFDVFGRPPYMLPNYRGMVPEEMRFPLMSQYRYNLCFENSNHPVFSLGYVDKILDCLETRTVPIYLGNPNIEEYVPRECFIDFRDFGSYEAVNDYLHSITDDEYMSYVENIDKWVSSGGLRPFSWFTLYDYLVRFYSTRTGTEFDSLVNEEWRWETKQVPPRTGTLQKPVWSFDELRFRPSQFMDPQDLLKTKPWEIVSRYLTDRVERASILASEEKYDEALMEMALGGFSLDANHHVFCAEIMQANGLQDAAFVQVTLALSIDPGHSYAHNLLGVLHFQKGELMKAEEELRKAVEFDDGNHLARKNLAFLLLNTGRREEGIPLAKTIEPYFPDEVRGWGIQDETGPGTARSGAERQF